MLSKKPQEYAKGACSKTPVSTVILSNTKVVRRQFLLDLHILGWFAKVTGSGPQSADTVTGSGGTQRWALGLEGADFWVKSQGLKWN